MVNHGWHGWHAFSAVRTQLHDDDVGTNFKTEISRIIAMPMGSHFPHQDGVSCFLGGVRHNKRHVSVVGGDL